MSEDRARDPRGLAGAAVRGSAWTTLQVVANKLAAAGTAVAMGYFLQPEEFGLAWFAVSAGTVASVIYVVAFGDVLLADPRRFVRLSGPIQRLAFLVASAQAALILAAGAALASAYPERTGLISLMAVVACRPLMEALALVPLARLRINLRYRQTSAIDAVTAVIASGAAIVMGRMGAGPYAIVLPPIAVIGVRAAMYRRANSDHSSAPVRGWRVTKVLVSRSLLSAFGAYLAGVLFLLETLVLGLFVPDRSLGIFTFAFGLASQVNSVVSYQIAGALQPILGHLGSDVARQVDGQLRACRLISSVLVPLLLVQAALGGQVIRILWEGKWDDAIPVFQAISVAQALYVCHWPAAFLMKAQGRFRGYVRVQLLNLLIAGVVFAIAAWRGGGVVADTCARLGLHVAEDAGAPLAVACASALVLVAIGPLMLWLACRPAAVPLRTIMSILWLPWMAAVPVAVVGAIAAGVVVPGPDFGMVGPLAALVGLGGACALVGMLAALGLSRAAREDVQQVIHTIRHRRAGLLPAASR